ncbi:MAG TPA: hypothetical protein VE136_00865 [Anaerolineales bacterium]|nr:hypothetical protein [Anaerolineales bacterium]
MQAADTLSRPETLVEGGRYIRKEDTRPGLEPILHPVTFISYCACPEFVIVQDEEGRKYRCLRKQIFTVKLDDLFMALAADIAGSM